MRAKMLGIPIIPSIFAYPPKIYQKTTGGYNPESHFLTCREPKIYQKTTGGYNSSP